MVSTERFHVSASSEGVKCFSHVIEFAVLALNRSLEICAGTLTETLTEQFKNTLILPNAT
jgi:hypothetical protein